MGAKFKFKKGDKVKLADNHDMAVWGRQDGETGVVTEDSRVPYVRWDRDGEIWAALEVELELVTPALRIEAGKFYKTRDGRKVGPIKRWTDDEHPWMGDLDRPYRGSKTMFIFKADGRNFEYTDLDIVAEWEEPAVSVAARNDNGTVKRNVPNVGDFVTQKSWHSGFHEVTSIDGKSLWIKVDGINDLRYDLKSDWIVRRSNTTPAIVALIENGQPKPATRPKVHEDQDSATKEAERLALSHPGQRFGVFILADSKIAERYEETVWGTRLVA